jgi:hypothetical protein
MAEFTCQKCGAAATSKCPWERSIFPRNQQATMLGYMVKFPGTEVVSGPPEYTYKTFKIRLEVSFSPTESRDGLTEEENAELAALLWLGKQSEEDLRHLVCEHRWTSEEPCLFGHDHSAREEVA